MFRTHRSSATSFGVRRLVAAFALSPRSLIRRDAILARSRGSGPKASALHRMTSEKTHPFSLFRGRAESDLAENDWLVQGPWINIPRQHHRIAIGSSVDRNRLIAGGCKDGALHKMPFAKTHPLSLFWDRRKAAIQINRHALLIKRQQTGSLVAAQSIGINVLGKRFLTGGRAVK